MAHTEEKLVNLLAAPIKNEGYELVDLEYNRHGSQQIIQLFIDNPNGIGIDDCVAVNQVVQEVMDLLVYSVNSKQLSIIKLSLVNESMFGYSKKFRASKML